MKKILKFIIISCLLLVVCFSSFSIKPKNKSYAYDVPNTNFQYLVFNDKPTEPPYWSKPTTREIMIKNFTFTYHGITEIYIHQGNLPDYDVDESFTFLGEYYQIHTYRHEVSSSYTWYFCEISATFSIPSMPLTDFIRYGVTSSHALRLTGSPLQELAEQYPNVNMGTSTRIFNCNLSFDFDLSNQYYYTRQYYFHTSIGVGTEDLYARSEYQQGTYRVALTDNNGNNFNSKMFNSGVDGVSQLCFVNNYNYNDSYIKSFSLSAVGNNVFTTDKFSNFIGFIDYGFRFFINVDEFSPYNLENYTGMLKSPNTPYTNSYYKNVEWWDVFGHIYNLIIYLIFDAPIISNVFKLINTTIQFITNIFTTTSTLFSNQYIVAIFVGFLVLTFIFKIFL